MAYTPFKMKGPSLYGKLKAQRNGYKNMGDGKSTSSPFQQSDASEKTIDQLIDEGFTPADARRMQKDGAQTGKSKATKEQIAKIKKNIGKKGKMADPKASPAKFIKKIGGALKGMVTGSDGKFGLGDVGRMALGPAGMLMGAGMGMKKMDKDKKKKIKNADKPVKPTDKDMEKYSDYTKYDEDGNKITRKDKRRIKKEFKAAKKAGMAGTGKKKSPAKKYGKSPMKGYKSDAQRKAVHASKADGGKSPAKMDHGKSPAKKYGKSPAKKYGKSPAKQVASKAAKAAGKAAKMVPGVGSAVAAGAKKAVKKATAKKAATMVPGVGKVAAAGKKAKSAVKLYGNVKHNKMQKSPAKKPLVGNQKNLPDHLKKKILEA